MKSLKHRRAFEGVHALRGEVRTRIKRNGSKVASFKGALAYRPPDTMRLRMFTPFGTTAADLVRVVGRTEVYVPGKDRLYVGWTPQVKTPGNAQYRAVIEDGWPVLEVTAYGEMAARYRYDPATGENISVQAYSQGKKDLEVRFSDYRGAVPEKIVFDFGELEVEIKLEDPEVIDLLEDRLFHPFKKEDMTVLPLGALFSGE